MSATFETPIEYSAYTVEILSWGNYVEFHDQSLLRPAIQRTKDRGDISGLSITARRRLVERLNKLEVQFQWMITLTYEDDSCGKTLDPDWISPSLPRPPDIHSKVSLSPLKLHLKKMLQWLDSFGIGAFWFLEFTSKGRPHFHLFLPFIPDQKTREVVRNGKLVEVACSDWEKECVRFWCKVAKQENRKFHEGGIIEKLRFTNGAAAYAAKEGNKRAQKQPPCACVSGRMWGHPARWPIRKPDRRAIIEMTSLPIYKSTVLKSFEVERLFTKSKPD